MGKAARNALKGYTFQHYIFTLFLAKMDSDRVIKRIEAEAITDGNFDDLYIYANENYRLQVKNYPNTKLEDIKITNDSVMIKGNVSRYNKEENNILIINTDQIQTDSEYMGFPSIVINKIVIIPLTPNLIQKILDEMFSSESREIQIIQFAFSLIAASCFEVTIEELPKVIRMTLDLSENTILIREPLNEINKGILWIVGKPGVGKSHYVEELIHKHNDAIVYRFWTGAQDENLMKRLQFNVFLDDLALAVFDSPKSYTKEELITELLSHEKTIIIDGLDHVENYNKKELNLFIEFIDLVKECRIVILSRPLNVDVKWKSMELINWNLDETALYLSATHNIYDYNIIKKIYEVTDGYPIITYFVAEHYHIYGEISIALRDANIFTFYETLLKDANVKSLLAIFATNNSFFLESELVSILENSFMIEPIMEFIKAYPYLFEKQLNRISLIHDSFNTYLRHEIDSYPELEDKVYTFVQNSLLKGNVNFMSRLSSFKLSEDFYKKLLVMYSKTDIFSDLLQRTLDFNSIASFYSQLQKLLEQRDGVLDIHGYYSFSLIYQIVCRNDLIGCEGLVYQIITYMNNHFIVEEELFSSGIMWRTHTLLELKDELAYKRYLVDNLYNSTQIDSLYEAVYKDRGFFKEREKIPNYEETLKELKSNHINQHDKLNILIMHMVRVWANQDREDFYYSVLDEYLNGNKEIAINQLRSIVKEFEIENIWAGRILPAVNYQLFELGKLRDENTLIKKSLEELIKITAVNGSYDVVERVRSAIRLANHENREVDIFSVNRVWAMYYNRKDYSVYTLDVALRVFERFGYLNEIESIDIIRKVMGQSEKGIRHLLTSYINRGEESLIYKLEQLGAFNDEEYPIDIFGLMPNMINCLDIKYINKGLNDLLMNKRYGKTIEYGDIINPLNSKYCNHILNVISHLGYKIVGWEKHEIFNEKVVEKGVESVEKKLRATEYIPFEHGCFHESDIEYIKNNRIGYLEVSRYTDISSSCLPYVDIFSIYDMNEIKKDYLKIIHNAIFARVPNREYFGNWYLLIGNIPKFADVYNIDVNWDIMYRILKWFLKESLICD
ncbi:hypothetical protein [Abiotrophia defectiva]|uniref:hypothetical protein n=1 Tax=Abiotrophia defectiva TaxID=46125 RepID=UPI0028D5C3B5|nr:hypothetical protein [Abiotrophia defectiva]